MATRQNSKRRRHAAQRAEHDQLLATVPPRYRHYHMGDDVEVAVDIPTGTGYLRGFFALYRGNMACKVRLRSGGCIETSLDQVTRCTVRYLRVRTSTTGGKRDTKATPLVTSQERLRQQLARADERLSDAERKTVTRGEHAQRKRQPRHTPARTRPRRHTQPASATVTRTGTLYASQDERRAAERKATKTTHRWLIEV